MLVSVIEQVESKPLVPKMADSWDAGISVSVVTAVKDMFASFKKLNTRTLRIIGTFYDRSAEGDDNINNTIANNSATDDGIASTDNHIEALKSTKPHIESFDVLVNLWISQRKRRAIDYHVRCGYVTCDLRYQWCDTVMEDCGNCAMLCGDEPVYPLFQAFCDQKCSLYMEEKKKNMAQKQNKQTEKDMAKRDMEKLKNSQTTTVPILDTSVDETETISTYILVIPAVVIILTSSVIVIMVIIIVKNKRHFAKHIRTLDQQTETTESLERVDSMNYEQKLKPGIRKAYSDSGVQDIHPLDTRTSLLTHHPTSYGLS